MEKESNNLHHCRVGEKRRIAASSAATRGHLLLLRNGMPPLCKETEGSANNNEEIERRVRVLQRLVPGGEEMDMDRLFEVTADYIEALEDQVGAMRALAACLDGSFCEKMMKGRI